MSVAKRRKQRNIGRIVLYVVTIAILAFLLAPLVIVVADSFNEVSYNVFPPVGFSLKWYEKALFSGFFDYAFSNSLVIALLATALSVIIGTLTSFVIVRYSFKGKVILLTFCMSPVILPAFIFGLGSMIFFFRLGIFGNFASVLLAHVVLTTPYVVRIMVSTLMVFDRTLEDAALSLGANPFQTFLRVTLPNISGGMLASALFSFIISFDEVAATIFLVRPGGLTTLPIEMFHYVEIFQDPAIAALSTLLMILSVMVVLLTSRFLRVVSIGRLLV
jgi:putative spermidine/putrescine transport system permease protein